MLPRFVHPISARFVHFKGNIHPHSSRVCKPSTCWTLHSYSSLILISLQSDYLAWAARKVQLELEEQGGEIGFGEEVIAVEAVVDNGGLEHDVKLLKVTSRNLKTGENVERMTRNLVLSTGGSPRVPQALTHDDIVATGRVIHTSEFLDKMRPMLAKLSSPLPHDRPLRVAVLGSGQVSCLS